MWVPWYAIVQQRREIGPICFSPFTDSRVSLESRIWLDQVIGLALLRRRIASFRDSSNCESASSAGRRCRRELFSAMDAENRRSSVRLARFLPFVSISEADYEIDQHASAKQRRRTPVHQLVQFHVVTHLQTSFGHRDLNPWGRGVIFVCVGLVVRSVRM